MLIPLPLAAKLGKLPAKGIGKLTQALVPTGYPQQGIGVLIQAKRYPLIELLESAVKQYQFSRHAAVAANNRQISPKYSMMFILSNAKAQRVFLSGSALYAMSLEP